MYIDTHVYTYIYVLISVFTHTLVCTQVSREMRGIRYVLVLLPYLSRLVHSLMRGIRSCIGTPSVTLAPSAFTVALLSDVIIRCHYQIIVR
jgi:hypothetical protein